MSTQDYQLHIEGLQESEGQIKIDDLQRVLDALIETASCATRLLAMGNGSGKGPKPRWLSATLGFTITGLKSGSTILDIVAPPLHETAPEAFAQEDMWNKQLNIDSIVPDSTALDIVTLAINEARHENSVGEYFDVSVLGAILKFKKAINSPGVCYALTKRGSEHKQFELKQSDYGRIAEQLKQTPLPKAFIVTGQLNEIKHGDGRFCLLLGDGSSLLGQIDRAALDIEELRTLWGKETTVEGMVHSKINGQPRLIEARRIGKRLDGDNILEEKPSVERSEMNEILSASEMARARAFDPMTLWGSWPGDETIEELLSQLDQDSH